MLWHRSGATPRRSLPSTTACPRRGRTWRGRRSLHNGERAAAWASAFAARRACFVHVLGARASVEAAVFGLPFFSQHLSAAQLSRSRRRRLRVVRPLRLRPRSARAVPLRLRAYLQRRGAPRPAARSRRTTPRRRRARRDRPARDAPPPRRAAVVGRRAAPLPPAVRLCRRPGARRCRALRALGGRLCVAARAADGARRRARRHRAAAPPRGGLGGGCGDVARVGRAPRSGARVYADDYAAFGTKL